MATLAQRWIENGAERGAMATAREILLAVLRRRFQAIPGRLQERIRMLDDVTLLRNLVEAAATAESIERFRDELETASRAAQFNPKG